MVLVFGTVCIDRLRRVPRIPAPGGYVEIESEIEMLGGEAANTANALHHWGDIYTLAPNALGDGPAADRLQSMLQEKGIRWIGPDATPAPDALNIPPVCDIYITPDGDRTMFGNGFNRMGPAVPIESIPYEPGQLFTAEPNMSEAARQAVSGAARAGMRCYLMDFARDDESIPAGSFWQCSTDWVGVRGNVQRNVEWLRAWVDRHGCFGIVSDGPNGFIAGSPTQPVRAYPPFPAPEVVDSTGAGDLFRAGMLHGLDRGWEIADCLRFASAAGCLKCAHLGATSYVPTAEAIAAHIARHPEVAERY